MLSGYITVDDFKESPYYCSFETCCGFSGNLDTLIESYINTASSLIENHLGYDLWSQEHRERFVGKDRNIYFTEFYPIQEINSLFYRERNRPSCTGIINTILTDDMRGILESDCKFISCRRYELIYTAGYETIPLDIKTACCILIAQLSQQIDLSNLASPNVGQSAGKLDQVINFSVGNNSGVLNNLLLKSVNDVQNLPITVYPILNKYKRGRLT